MIKPIMKDIFFLNQKSELATQTDIEVAHDLLDTLKANEKDCVGLAANMIGVKKRIIAISMGHINMAMINPVILHSEDEYEAEEGCLSLSGVRKARRFQEIEVSYLDVDFKEQKGKFNGVVAQIIQHELDHCNGILI